MNQAWPWRPLGEVFEIGTGKTMSAAARDGADKTPFLRTSNVLWDEIDLSSVDEMSIPEHELPAKLLRQGDLIVCEGGEIGRAAIWSGEVETMSFQNHLHRLRPLTANVDPRFYVFFFQAAFTLLGLFEGAGNRTTIPNLSRNRLAELQIPQPPIDEQLAICAVLGQVRDAIRVQKQIIALVQELKHASTRILFTHGLRGEAQKETEIGPVPESWNETTLLELCMGPWGSLQTGPFGNQLHKDDYQDTGIPVVNPTHLRTAQIDDSNVPRVSRKDVRRLERHRLEATDILVARRGQIGRFALVTEAEEGWLCGTGCFLVRVRRPHVDNRFLAHLLSTEPLVMWLTTHAAGAIMPNLNKLILGRTPVVLPQVTEQREIVAVLNAVDRKIELHRRRCMTLEKLFKSLLSQFMEGAIDLQDLTLDTRMR